MKHSLPPLVTTYCDSPNHKAHEPFGLEKERQQQMRTLGTGDRDKRYLFLSSTVFTSMAGIPLSVQAALLWTV